MYVQSVGDLLYPVIIESQDTSDTTEDVEVPDGEELSSDYLKDEEEHFTIEEQEIDHVTRTRNSNALDLEGLNDFIADQDRQREAEPNAELRGSLKGVLVRIYCYFMKLRITFKSKTSKLSVGIYVCLSVCLFV